jgi:F0F1-type ATP synthase assembly protein I
MPDNNAENTVKKPAREPAGPKLANDPDPSGVKTFGRYLSVGLMLPVGSMVGYGIGYELDLHFGTHWLAIVLMLLGTVGGFIQLIREVTR